MQPSCRRFIDELTQYSDGLKMAWQEVLAYWKPEDPPVTLVFSELGDRIADDIWVTPDVVSQRIFWLIEDAMINGDSVLATAVATGLIEAVVTKAFQEEEKLSHILSMFGEESRKHAEAWLGE